MNKKINKFILIILIITMITPLFSLTVHADKKITYNRYNIVLVTDTSGSMRDTDKNNLRFEAMSKFIALLAEHGNSIGTVVFNGDIVHKQPIIEANGIEIKRSIVNDLEKTKPSGYTNIGKALQTAVDMLNTNKNSELPSIILLLTDGNSEMKTNDELLISLDQKAEAIQQARINGYKIYTISLNADGEANSAELNQIAAATGGQFEEVVTAEDLEEVFAMYYNLIYSTTVNTGEEKVFPESGNIFGTFNIPLIGVEEVNIVLNGDATDYTLTDPNEKFYSKEEIIKSTYVSDTFSVIKIVNPVSGEWNYSISGISGDKIQINIIYNTNLHATIESNPQKESYMAGDEINFRVLLNESDNIIPIEKYEGFEAFLNIINGNGETQKFSMPKSSNGFEYKHIFNQSGSFTVNAAIISEGYEDLTDQLIFNIDNIPPISEGDIDIEVLLWPFNENITTIDLSAGAKNPEESDINELFFEVLSGSYMNDEYTIDGNNLIMNKYSLSKGSITIKAYNKTGAFCTFEVNITTINMTLVFFIILIAVILIVVIIIGIVTWILLNKRFMGSCHVTKFDSEDNYYDEIMREKGRGRIKLSAFNIQDVDLDTSKCYFQASGKNFVYFISNKPVYGDGLTAKKTKIEGNGYDTIIMSDANNNKGIRIRFVSRMNRDMNW